MNIVLFQPEIPHNTGAIGRTCLMTGSTLHLIRPYGFFLDEKSRRRAGLDYWHRLAVHEYDNFTEFYQINSKINPQINSEKNPHGRFFFIETTGGKIYSEENFKPNDYLILGSETTGLPQEITAAYPNQILRIPMTGEDRSLNLSVAAGIVLYEALRQTGFADLC